MSAGVELGLLCAAVIASYLHAARHVRWPRSRSAAFVFGAVALALSLSGPVDARAQTDPALHMAQHLVIALVAAPLLVLGAPLTLALRRLRGRSRARLAAALASRPLRVLGHPVTGVALFGASMLATHMTGVYDAALRDGDLHALEHAVLLAGGIALWQPLLAPAPRAHRVSSVGRAAVLLGAMPPMAAIGAWLITTGTVRYPHYVVAAGSEGAALRAQREAGAVMWVGGSLLMVAALVAIVWTGLVDEERRAVARERYSARRTGAAT